MFWNEIRHKDGTVSLAGLDGILRMPQEDGTTKYINSNNDKEWISDGTPVYKIEGEDIDVLIYEDGSVQYGNLPKVDRTSLYYARPYRVPLPVFLAKYYHSQEGGKVIPLTDRYGELRGYYPTEEEIAKMEASGVLF